MITIRKNRREDSRAVASLISQTYARFNRHEGTEEAVRDYIKSYNPDDKTLDEIHKRICRTRFCFVAVTDSHVVGVVRGNGHRLVNLFVDGGFHRRGIATRLVRRYEEACQDAGLSYIVVRSSLYAVPFYQSVGYKKTTGVRNFQGLTIQPMKKIFNKKVSTSTKYITEAKDRFNKCLMMSTYQKMIADDVQCMKLIELLKVRDGGTYLDLATGAGYVGFKIAEQFPGCSVTGIDIADKVILANTKRSKERSISNIEFISFDGITFPEFTSAFDGIICRFALHHFPKIEVTLEEIRKILKQEGRVVISDAVRHEHDDEDFINTYQQYYKDGHIRMYTRNEMVHLFQVHNFAEADSFDSTLTVSTELNPYFQCLLEATSKEIKEKYSVAVSYTHLRAHET